MPRLSKILVANRGEIAVRVIRACRDAGLASVAAYADPDRDAPFVRLADEAFALGGSTAGESYLAIDKLIDVAQPGGRRRRPPRLRLPVRERRLRAGRHRRGPHLDRPHPAGHPRPRRQGHRPAHRHARGRPARPRHQRPGLRRRTRSSRSPRSTASRSRSRRRSAAAAAGSRSRARRRRSRELYESAVREAKAAFGRGECFVERYLDKPRHVEAQVLADTHGSVVVVGTRDCSLQRRFQKLVEEAPAPFLSDEQRATIHEAAKAICREAGYHGAGTVEFLVGPGRADLVPRGQHPAAGGAPGLGGDLGHRPRARAVPHRRGRAAAVHRRPDAARALHRVPHQRRGRRAELPPVAGHDHRAHAAVGARRAGRRGRRGGFGDRRAVRLAAGQADRHRFRPRAGAGALAARAGRVPGGGHGHGAAVPPAGGRGPGVHDRFHGAHPVDRDRVGQHRRAVRGRGGDRGRAGAAVGGRRGRRAAAGGHAARRLASAGSPRPRPRRRHPGGAAAARAARRRPATRSRRRCRARSSRSRCPTATRSPRATSSSCWRR